MRVLHVLQSLHPRFGGPPAVVLRLASSQANLGTHVGLLSYQISDESDTVSRSISLVPNISMVERFDLPIESGWISRALASNIGTWIARNAHNWDVVHLHNIWDPAVRAGASAARRAGLNYVITPHGSLDPWAMRQKPLKRAKKLAALAMQMRSLLDGSMFLHVLNEDERVGLAELGLRARTEVVANGILLEELSDLPPRGSFRKQVPDLGDAPFILFLSRIHQKKGLDILVDAFAPICATHSDLKLVVAGPDDGALERNRERARQLAVHDRVHFVGPLYGREKYAALIDASVFCLPSRMEGFSIAILEALACSCPVVISENCHFPEVAEASAGRVLALHAAHFTEALNDYLNNPTLAKVAGARGRTLVEERYTWPVIAQQLLDLYLTHLSR
jgi:glycosyltransferase involved in cell wall biosynthesis